MSGETEIQEIENFIRQMPKVELNLHLEGAFKKETLLLIAEQNDITPLTYKKFKDWVALIDKPQPVNLHDISKTISEWLAYPDDITRLVYDAGVYLAKQNVRYAELIINPVYHMLPNMSFDEFIAALNDGRDRVARGWGVKMNWILVVPRHEPRRADEIARWTATASAKKNNIVGFGLTGSQRVQPVGQFERAFNLVHKKDLPTIAEAITMPPNPKDEGEAEGIATIVTRLKPTRIMDGWGLLQDEALLQSFSESQMPVVLSMNRAKWMGWVGKSTDYPLRRLYDENINIVLSTDMPLFYGTSINDEYLQAVNEHDLSLEAIQEMMVNSVMASFMPEDQKAVMVTEFMGEFERLLSEENAAEAE